MFSFALLLNHRLSPFCVLLNKSFLVLDKVANDDAEKSFVVAAINADGDFLELRRNRKRAAREERHSHGRCDGIDDDLIGVEHFHEEPDD